MENTVELIGWYGGDEAIACSAWTSTSRNLTAEKKARIPQLVHKLWSDGHETPFEKGIVQFLVNCDIASHIHLLKHRIASINAESARYKELKEDKYYLPEDWAGIDCSVDYLINCGQLGIGQKKWYDKILSWFGISRGQKSWHNALSEYTQLGNLLYHKCLADLEPVLGRKRAKESARFFKTYNSQIQADVMFNMRSFANFLKLRTSKSAQVEIREIATQMLELVKAIPENPFEHTIAAIEKSIDKPAP